MNAGDRFRGLVPGVPRMLGLPQFPLVGGCLDKGKAKLDFGIEKVD